MDIEDTGDPIVSRVLSSILILELISSFEVLLIIAWDPSSLRDCLSFGAGNIILKQFFKDNRYTNT